LISNGIKYRSKSAPEIHISARKRESEWLFAVRDNGIGIASENHDHVFEMFRRLHSMAEYPGTGIGLAICKKIVESLGGRIWVASEAAAGATFYFTLPDLG
jgi:light-regulated signal transduction histidine kinase (bacteriophytochrome)